MLFFIDPIPHNLNTKMWITADQAFENVSDNQTMPPKRTDYPFLTHPSGARVTPNLFQLFKQSALITWSTFLCHQPSLEP